jgi:hypothetical protein
MQNAGVAFPVRPAGHLGSGAEVAALALAAAKADEEDAGAFAEGCAGALLASCDAAEAEAAAAVPLASSLSQATTARRSADAMTIRMAPRIRGLSPRSHVL